jgi:hypothetical protein
VALSHFKMKMSSQGGALYCGKKVLTTRISGPDKYRQVVLGLCRGVYGPMVNCCEDYGAFLDW